MVRNKVSKGTLLSALALLLVVGATSAQTAPPRPQKKPVPRKAPPAVKKLQLEPKAVEILKAASDRLAAAHTLSFTAVELFEHLSRQGAPLAYTTKYEVTLQRPDKLRVLMPADGSASDFYYDGKTMTAFAPAENLVATTDAPATIDAAMEKAYHLAAIYFPFDDLIVANPYGDLAPGLKHAYYIGQSRVVGGTTTDMVAYAGDGVFVQIWIGAEDKLPRLMRAVFLDDPDRLRHELALSGWKLDETVPADAFAPANVANAKKIPFAPPHPESPPDAKPAVRIMKTIIASVAGLAIALLPLATVSAYSHANRYGGSTSHSYGSTSHTSSYGTSTSHTYGQGTSHTNYYGGSTSHNYGGGTTHTNAYGGTTSGAYGEGAYHSGYYGAAYHPPDTYYGYHPPTTVNYYGGGCYDCGGDVAGAALAGAAIGATVGAVAASSSSAAASQNAYAQGYTAGATTAAANTSAATSNAYNAGYTAGATNTAVAYTAGTAATTYSTGQIVAVLPGGCITPSVSGGATYYLCGNTWVSPSYGANGVYYKVVPTP